MENKPKTNTVLLVIIIILLAVILGYNIYNILKPIPNNLPQENQNNQENNQILSTTATAIKQEINKDDYQEFSFDSFDSGEPSTSSHIQIKNIRKSYSLLDNNSSILPAVSLNQKDVNLYTDGQNTYKLINKDIGDKNCHSIEVYKNNKLLFSDKICGNSPLGDVIDWRLINGKIALTYNKDCNGNCSTEIFYDGKFITKEYKVKNPRYLFFYNNKVGFITSEFGAMNIIDGLNTEEKIFWDGKYITPSFDSIHTTSCCSSSGELEPTVFENGTLLFFAKRGEKNYLAEVKLSSNNLNKDDINNEESTSEFFTKQPGAIKSILANKDKDGFENGSWTLSVDLLSDNPRWVPGDDSTGGFFINQNEKLRNLLVLTNTKTYECGEGPDGNPTTPDVLEINTSNYINYIKDRMDKRQSEMIANKPVRKEITDLYTAYLDINGANITAIYEQCLP